MPSRSSPVPAWSPASHTDVPTAAPVSCETNFLQSLPLRRKLAQLLNVGVTGTADAAQVVRNEQVGGIFIGSWTDEAMLAGREVPQVASASALPLMVTIDEEGGRVSRVEDLLGPDPSARQTAATMTEEETYRMVIGDRSYSDDPAVVTRYADAYARGMRDAGILPVIKHFPGHGSASGDSHTGAVTTPPLEQLQTYDLVPYRDLVTTGVGVMLGHLEVPGLTAPGIPASISPDAVALLRGGTGYGAPPFTGPIFTDDLSGMQAITDRYDITEAVETSLASGVDIALWLTTDDVPRVLDHLESVVASGKLPQQRVDDAVLTVARAKGALPC
jgi:beta-N-acetylhexosaminidase